MVGIVIDVAPRVNLYATYSSAFETPTTTEFNKPDGTGGFNLNLDPQLATNLEVGVRGSFNGANRYEVALFTIEVEEELIPFEVVPGRNAFENAGQSTRDGLEFSLISNPTDRLRTTVSYTYSDFKFDEFVDLNNPLNDFTGNVIPGTAENVLFGEVSYVHPRGWFAAGDVLFVDEQFGDNANAVVIGDYTVASLRFGYDLTLGEFSLSPFVGINNLFDETYTANVRLNAFGGRFFEPGPGRNGYAGVSLNYRFR
jgi:iron complex outermembrane receptor protein